MIIQDYSCIRKFTTDRKVGYATFWEWLSYKRRIGFEFCDIDFYSFFIFIILQL